MRPFSQPSYFPPLSAVSDGFLGYSAGFFCERGMNAENKNRVAFLSYPTLLHPSQESQPWRLGLGTDPRRLLQARCRKKSAPIFAWQDSLGPTPQAPSIASRFMSMATT